MGIHAPMQTGVPDGVSLAGLEPPVQNAHREKCACGCGRTVDTEYEHFVNSDGRYFYDVRCVLAYYEVREVF